MDRTYCENKMLRRCERRELSSLLALLRTIFAQVFAVCCGSQQQSGRK